MTSRDAAGFEPRKEAAGDLAFGRAQRKDGDAVEKSLQFLEERGLKGGEERLETPGGLFYGEGGRPGSEGAPEAILYVLIGVAILVSFSLAPLIWLKFFFRKYAEARNAALDDQPALARLYGEFQISKREQEILELILEGKNNREIEKTLFISYHTVKNHVYNIYQKLGVNNRYQLMSMINARRAESRPGPRS